jgi:hypothetical protein
MEREHFFQSSSLIDEQIAIKVLGWKLTKQKYIHFLAHGRATRQWEDFGCQILMPPDFEEDGRVDSSFDVPRIPEFSRSLEEAMKVLQYIQFHLDPIGRMWRPQLTSYKDKWRCEFELTDDNAGDDATYYWAEAPTLTEAICLASLKAVE